MVDHCDQRMTNIIGVTLISPVEIRKADELACEVCGYVLHYDYAPQAITTSTDEHFESTAEDHRAWARYPREAKEVPEA